MSTRNVVRTWFLVQALLFTTAFGLVLAARKSLRPGWTPWQPPTTELYTAWGWAYGCTSHEPVLPVQPENVKFFLADSLPLDAVGMWYGPDTIAVEPAWKDSVWVLAHELVHYRMGGPPGRVDHPVSPFLFPCRLMWAQNVGHRQDCHGYSGKTQTRPVR